VPLASDRLFVFCNNGKVSHETDLDPLLAGVFTGITHELARARVLRSLHPLL